MRFTARQSALPDGSCGTSLKISSHALAYRAEFAPALTTTLTPSPHGPAQLGRRRNLPAGGGS